MSNTSLPPPRLHASSNAYRYPLLGATFIARNRYLHPPLKSRILPVTLLTSAITIALLFFAYIPQALLLLPFHGRPAFLNALILTLGESAALTQLLFETFIIDGTLVNIFDAVLVAHGHDRLVGTARTVLPASEGNPVERLYELHHGGVFLPWSLRQIVEFVLLLPLTLIPWIGVPLFIFGTGYRAGPLLLHRYFGLRGFGRKEKKEWIRQRRRALTGIGIVHVCFEMVPVLAMGLLVCTATGAGLWAGKEEDERLGRDDDGSNATGATGGEDTRSGLNDGTVRGYGTNETGRDQRRDEARDGPPPPYREYEDDPLP